MISIALDICKLEFNFVLILRFDGDYNILLSRSFMYWLHFIL